MKTIFCSLLIVISMQNWVFANEVCKNAETQAELNECAKSEYVKADRELNKIYKQITSSLPKVDLRNLKSAQRLWIKFKEKNCYAEKMLYDKGSIAPMVYDFCLHRITRVRIKDLKQVYIESTN